MDTIIAINDFVNNIVWGAPTLLLIIGTSLFLTYKLGFVQFKNIGFLIHKTIVEPFRKDEKKSGAGDVTSFQAAMMSVSGIVGSGNIAGVATAIMLGGPGAVLWMNLAALIGMATKFSEIALGLHYRKVNPDGTVSGGPMYYLSEGLGKRWVGMLYAVLAVCMSFVISPFVDTNVMVTTLNESFNIPILYSGIFFAILTGMVIFGGFSRIGRVAEFVAPFMGGGYILAGIVIIILNITRVPAAFVEIIQAAFDPAAITGGVVGSMLISMRYGMARGLLSNEAGLGTAAMVHSAAKVKHPIEQAVWGPVEVFLDTTLVCSVSALVIVLSGLWKSGEYTSANLTVKAFGELIPFGEYICIGAVILFGFSCLYTFYTYAERSVEFITESNKYNTVIRVLWVAAIIVGAVAEPNFVWDLADTFNGLMIYPNLIGLVLLHKVVVNLKDEYYAEQLPLYYEHKKNNSKSS